MRGRPASVAVHVVVYVADSFRCVCRALFGHLHTASNVEQRFCLEFTLPSQLPLLQTVVHCRSDTQRWRYCVLVRCHVSRHNLLSPYFESPLWAILSRSCSGASSDSLRTAAFHHDVPSRCLPGPWKNAHDGEGVHHRPRELCSHLR